MAAEVGVRRPVFTHMPRVDKRRSGRIGLFHVQYSILQSNWTEEDYLALGDWLAENCTENYIYLRCTSQTVGGGTTNNLWAWNRYRRWLADPSSVHPSQIEHQHGIMENYKLRLMKADDLLFRLSWLNDLP